MNIDAHVDQLMNKTAYYVHRQSVKMHIQLVASKYYNALQVTTGEFYDVYGRKLVLLLFTLAIILHIIYISIYTFISLC